MRSALIRKTRADFASRPLQTVLLFIVIAAAAATLSLALNVRASSEKPFDRLYEEANSADLWITVEGDAGFDVADIATLPGVEALGDPYPVSWRNYAIRSGDTKQQFALAGMPSELPEFDHPVVTKGEWLSADGANEIVVDSGAAKLLGLNVGDQVDLLTPSLVSRQFTVVGFAVTTSRAPAPNDDPSFAYILPSTLAELTANDPPEEAVTTRAGMRLAPGLQFFELIDQMQQARMIPQMNLPPGAVPSQPGGTIQASGGGPDGDGGDPGVQQPAFDFRNVDDVRSAVTEASLFDVLFLQVFSVFALLAAGLIIANAVGGQVLSQVRDLGILKSVGMTPRQITGVLLLPNLVIGVFAALVGIGAGLLIAPYFLSRTASVLGMPSTPVFAPALLAITLIIVVAIVAVFTFIPAWRAGRTNVIRALEGAEASSGGASSRVAHLAAKAGLPRFAVVGIADLSRRRLRTTMTVFALVMVVVTATFSLGLEATFAATMKNPAVVGAPPYDIIADRDAYLDADARAILDASPEVESYLVAYNANGWMGANGFDLQGFDGDLTARPWSIREGRMPSATGEAVVSTDFVRRFASDVGDKVTVEGRNGSPSFDVKIVGRYVDIDGEAMLVNASTLPAGFEPTDYYIKTKSGTDNEAFAGKLIEASGGNLSPELLLATIVDIRDQFRTILVALNAVLLSIAGINLLSSLLLSVREQQRDFAILKTVGFTPRQVVLAVFSSSVAVALIAVAIGLPLGLLATKVVFTLITRTTGSGNSIGTMPGVEWLAPLVPAAVVLAILATLLPARRAASMRVADAIRYQ